MMSGTSGSADSHPSHLVRRLDSVPTSTIVFSLAPFLISWIVTAVVTQKKLFPALSEDASATTALPLFQGGSAKESRRPSALYVAKLVCSASIGLSTVLIELLLCEISSTLNPAARGLALRITLTSLLISCVLLIPALEIHGFSRMVLGSSLETSTKQTKPRIRMLLDASLLAAWLLVFWYLPGSTFLRKSLHDVEYGGHDEGNHSFTEACLERVGVIGISLMASLAGFAAVSAIWQTFGVKHRRVSDTDISRKEAGLTAAEEMLSAKQSRLRALQTKMADAAASENKPGLMGRMMGSIRGNPDSHEIKSLEMEISGLQTMRHMLSSSLATLRTRQLEQHRSKPRTGQLLNVFNVSFALYCAYRICATSLSGVRRLWQPRNSFATSDPINNFLALLTAHWDSELDHAAWSRQISFLLSGFMLLLAFNAVLQTSRLFSRFFPSLSRHTQASLPLMISQVAGTYVISSALLLRSNLPAEVSSVISEALGAPLEPRFVDGWFESWFLFATVLTALGILIGRKVSSDDDGSWDDDGYMELGSKRS